MDFIVFFIFAAVIGIAAGIIRDIEKSNKQKEVGSIIANLQNFTTAYEYLGSDGNSGIAIDEIQSKVCLLSRSGNGLSHRIFEHKDILSSELFEDGEILTKTVRSSQVIGTAVGGVLLGGVGAVIGGLSGKKVEKGKIKRIELRLVVNDPANPVHDICFLHNEIKRDGTIYKTVSDKARQWQARLDVLIKRADSEDKTINANDTSSSIADELKKLAELRDAGILSIDEFQQQKSRLLVG